MTTEEKADPLTQHRSGSQKRQRHRQVNVGFLPAEYLVLEEKAATAGLSAASYVRACSLGSAGPRARRAPTIEAAVLRDCTVALQSAAKNLERIAGLLNQAGSDGGQEAQDVFQMIRDALVALGEAVGRET